MKWLAKYQNALNKDTLAYPTDMPSWRDLQYSTNFTVKSSSLNRNKFPANEGIFGLIISFIEVDRGLTKNYTTCSY